MATLHELVNPESISLDVEAADWRSAMRAVGQLLVDAGVCDGSYVDSMVANVEQHGPYIVIAPGLAFAHAQVPGAIKRTGMAWIRLRTPVDFGHPEHDPVSLIAALGAMNSSAHIMATRQLATAMDDDAIRNTLETARTPTEFHAALGN